MTNYFPFLIHCFIFTVSLISNFIPARGSFASCLVSVTTVAIDLVIKNYIGIHRSIVTLVVYGRFDTVALHRRHSSSAEDNQTQEEERYVFPESVWNRNSVPRPKKLRKFRRENSHRRRRWHRRRHNFHFDWWHRQINRLIGCFGTSQKWGMFPLVSLSL